MIQTVASDKVIDEAYRWLCKTRVHRHANDDVWHLRRNWSALKPQIQHDLRVGCYRFSPCRAVRVEQHSLGIWNASDALVQKALTLVLSDAWLPTLSCHCYHIKGRGGAKAAVQRIRTGLGEYDYVLKSDVKSYYASLNHSIIMEQARELVDDAIVCDLIHQFLDHLDDVNGALFPADIGVGKGSSLSPLIGALYLHALDQKLEHYAAQHDLLYCRFMDDWLLLTRKRGHLRKAVRAMNHVLERLKLSKAPDKTYIGRISKGFDFLGYRFGDVPLATVGIAQATWNNHFDKLTQCVRRGFDEEALLDYIKRWWSWVRVEGLMLSF